MPLSACACHGHAAFLTLVGVEDEDVAAERQRVEAPHCNDVVKALNITKVCPVLIQLIDAVSQQNLQLELIE